jgi:hypothetical protein
MANEAASEVVEPHIAPVGIVKNGVWCVAPCQARLAGSGHPPERR